MRPPISSKLPNVGTTIFTVMSQLANDCRAINLSQGFPSFDPPVALTERIAHHLINGANQYAPMPGVPSLRQAIVEKTAQLYGRDVDVDSEITISTGGTEGIFSAIQATVRPGDEVIVFDPAYDSYEPAVTLAGGRTRHISMTISSDGFDFCIDWQALRDTINKKTRLLIINFPQIQLARFSRLKIWTDSQTYCARRTSSFCQTRFMSTLYLTVPLIKACSDTKNYGNGVLSLVHSEKRFMLPAGKSAIASHRPTLRQNFARFINSPRSPSARRCNMRWLIFCKATPSFTNNFLLFISDVATIFVNNWRALASVSSRR